MPAIVGDIRDETEERKEKDESCKLRARKSSVRRSRVDFLGHVEGMCFYFIYDLVAEQQKILSVNTHSEDQVGQREVRTSLVGKMAFLAIWCSVMTNYLVVTLYGVRDGN